MDALVKKIRNEIVFDGGELVHTLKIDKLYNAGSNSLANKVEAKQDKKSKILRYVGFAKSIDPYTSYKCSKHCESMHDGIPCNGSVAYDSLKKKDVCMSCGVKYNNKKARQAVWVMGDDYPLDKCLELAVCVAQTVIRNWVAGFENIISILPIYDHATGRLYDGITASLIPQKIIFHAEMAEGKYFKAQKIWKDGHVTIILNIDKKITSFPIMEKEDMMKLYIESLARFEMVRRSEPISMEIKKAAKTKK